ncbi:hypothetical protein [Asticcacaulis tiandongensis]|uniref:hypothetical protein n=1 Tax=Asticcacaulis tiandongensis TaxID=2565365 RepID=UPI0011281033|nr:hypothetical protein [Asticcacaulis tiandongensis]
MKNWKTHLGWVFVIFITAYLFHNIGKNSVTAEDVIVMSSKSVDHYDGKSLGKSLHFQGTWKIEEGSIAWPKNISHYDCWLDNEGYCNLTEATIYKNSLNVRTSKFVKIIKWDDQQVILEQSGTSNCRDFVVVVDLLTQEVTGITKDTPNRPESCSETLPPLEKPRISKMIDGFRLSFPRAEK